MAQRQSRLNQLFRQSKMPNLPRTPIKGNEQPQTSSTPAASSEAPKQQQQQGSRPESRASDSEKAAAAAVVAAAAKAAASASQPPSTEEVLIVTTATTTTTTPQVQSGPQPQREMPPSSGSGMPPPPGGSGRLPPNNDPPCSKSGGLSGSLSGSRNTGISETVQQVTREMASTIEYVSAGANRHLFRCSLCHTQFEDCTYQTISAHQPVCPRVVRSYIPTEFDNDDRVSNTDARSDISSSSYPNFFDNSFVPNSENFDKERYTQEMHSVAGFTTQFNKKAKFFLKRFIPQQASQERDEGALKEVITQFNKLAKARFFAQQYLTVEQLHSEKYNNYMENTQALMDQCVDAILEKHPNLDVGNISMLFQDDPESLQKLLNEENYEYDRRGRNSPDGGQNPLAHPADPYAPYFKSGNDEMWENVVSECGPPRPRQGGWPQTQDGLPNPHNPVMHPRDFKQSNYQNNSSHSNAHANVHPNAEGQNAPHQNAPPQNAHPQNRPFDLPQGAPHYWASIQRAPPSRIVQIMENEYAQQMNPSNGPSGPINANYYAPGGSAPSGGQPPAGGPPPAAGGHPPPPPSGGPPPPSGGPPPVAPFSHGGPPAAGGGMPPSGGPPPPPSGGHFAAPPSVPPSAPGYVAYPPHDATMMHMLQQNQIANYKIRDRMPTFTDDYKTFSSWLECYRIEEKVMRELRMTDHQMLHNFRQVLDEKNLDRFKNVTPHPSAIEECITQMISHYGDEHEIKAKLRREQSSFDPFPSSFNASTRDAFTTLWYKLNTLHNSLKHQDMLPNGGVDFVHFVLPAITLSFTHEWHKYVARVNNRYTSQDFMEKLWEWIQLKEKSFENEQQRLQRYPELKKSSQSQKKNQNQSSSSSSSSSLPQAFATNKAASSETCAFCNKAAHEQSFKCPVLKEMSPSQRNKVVSKEKLCIRCLKRNHGYRECPSKLAACNIKNADGSICNKPHARLLHSDKNKEKPLGVKQTSTASEEDERSEGTSEAPQE